MAIFSVRATGHTSEGETWNSGWWSSSSLSDIDQALAIATTFWDDLWNSNLGSEAPPASGLDQVTVGLYATIDGQQIARRDAAVTLTGTSTGLAIPGDNAVVITLVSELANRRGRGRMYMPAPTTEALAADGRLANTYITQLASGAALRFANAAQAGAGLVAQVRSLANLSFAQVTRVQVGDLMDTQRRRQNKLVETREEAVI